MIRHGGMLVGALLVCSACAATAPRELVDARVALREANESEASVLSPLELEQARTALERAERTHTRGNDPATVRDLSYIARRKAELAMVKSELAVALEPHELPLPGREDRPEQKTDSSSARLDRSDEDAATWSMQTLGRLGSRAVVSRDERGVVVTIAGYSLFDAADYTLRTQGELTLDLLAGALVDDADSRVIITSYADRADGSEFETRLARDRAETIRAFLNDHGVPNRRVLACAGRPTGSGVEGWASDRRVEIVVKPARATLSCE